MDYLKMTFLSKTEEKDEVLDLVKVFVQNLDATKQKKEDIYCATSEVLINAIDYAYPESNGKISLEMKVLYGFKRYKSVLGVKVQDKGIGIQDIQKAMEIFYTTGDKEEHSGLGFSIMKTFSNKLKVDSHPDKGTIIKMKFNL